MDKFLWFDYCLKGFVDNCGLCIDFLLVSVLLVECCVEIGIDYDICSMEKFFDYVLVWVMFCVWFCFLINCKVGIVWCFLVGIMILMIMIKKFDVVVVIIECDGKILLV